MGALGGGIGGPGVDMRVEIPHVGHIDDFMRLRKN